MAGLFSGLVVWTFVYRQARSARLCQALFCASALLTASLSGGCSTSYQLGSTVAKDDDASLRTGAVKAVANPTSDGVQMPPAYDLIYAKVAVAEILGRGAKDASQSWENPQSGARGTVTPLADAYQMEGALCRDFLASYVAEGAESWLQGEACQGGRGHWEVRRLKPWRRT